MIAADIQTLIRDRFLGPCRPSQNPTIYCMAGIPGAGKSTYVDAALADGTFPAGAFLLDPDRVMNALPGYRDALHRDGAQGAFHAWELPARDLAYAMLDDAAALRADIIKDMGCARMENYEKLKSLKQSGYRLHMVYIDCPVELALTRIATRPRHTPPDMIHTHTAALRDLLPLYRELADCFVEAKTQ